MKRKHLLLTLFLALGINLMLNDQANSSLKANADGGIKILVHYYCVGTGVPCFADPNGVQKQKYSYLPDVVTIPIEISW